jgi:hypothetical protein
VNWSNIRANALLIETIGQRQARSCGLNLEEGDATEAFVHYLKIKRNEAKAKSNIITRLFRNVEIPLPEDKIPNIVKMVNLYASDLKGPMTEDETLGFSERLYNLFTPQKKTVKKNNKSIEMMETDEDVEQESEIPTGTYKTSVHRFYDWWFGPQKAPEQNFQQYHPTVPTRRQTIIQDNFAVTEAEPAEDEFYDALESLGEDVDLKNITITPLTPTNTANLPNLTDVLNSPSFNLETNVIDEKYTVRKALNDAKSTAGSIAKCATKVGCGTIGFVWKSLPYVLDITGGVAGVGASVLTAAEDLSKGTAGLMNSKLKK